MTSIGIIGAGTAGLHLGLRLQMHGIPATLYTEREPAELRSARLPNTVAHNGLTRSRERILGVNHWDSPDFGIFTVGVSVSGPQPLRLRGRLTEPGIFVDYRLYQPRLAEDFVARGGRIEVGPVDAATVERLSERHDLMVVATGRGSLGQMFPRIPEHSPYTQPQRLLFIALVHGIPSPEPMGMQFNISPGHGDVFEGRVMSRHGHTASILVEAAPGGALEALCTRSVDADPQGFHALMLETLREHAPATFERLIPSEFRITAPLDWSQGGFTPVVRKGWAALGSGRFAVAVGDAHVLHDPISGMGANAASASAWELAEGIHEAVRSGQPFDQGFCERAEARAWETVRATTIWTNAQLQDPPPHFIEVLIAASQDQGLADALLNVMVDAQKALATFATPETTAAFLAAR